MRNSRILISGAGIAGQTLAYWLARQGFQPTIVERAASLRLGGQGVDVRERAIEVVERMGLMPQVRSAAADVLGMRFVDADGRGLGEVNIQKIKERNGSDEVEIMRGDLVRLLHDSNGDTVEYLFGESISTLEQDADGVTVEFERGGRRRFDLVVGADGLHSTVRRMAFGPEERFVHHLEHYFAFGDADPALGPDRWVTVYNTPGSMAGIYRSGAHPQAKAYLAFRSPRREFDPRDPAAARRALTEQFGRDPAWQVARLLESVLADDDMYFDALTQVRMPTWANGRVVLVGDAAHCASPVSGGGAELALTAAYRLADELAAADGDHEQAFARYERAQRPSVGRRQQIGPNLRLLIPRTRASIKIRNTLTRLPVLESLAGMERIMAPRNTEPLTTARTDTTPRKSPESVGCRA
ncbi:FAD-dependent monooxygenase [Nocardia miyunensis]|uniref:FAD-dependent monooxygenase n=1 Tax=Nocardia miyunensis TaxID=282684 RepID=UPI0008367FB8|nr:FAD-dependent monooxygenase [Nocardia miyunensis]